MELKEPPLPAAAAATEEVRQQRAALDDAQWAAAEASGQRAAGRGSNWFTDPFNWCKYSEQGLGEERDRQR